MARVFIPPMLRALTGGVERIDVAAGRVAEVIAAIDLRYPGFGAAVLEDGRLAPGLAVAVNSEVGVDGLFELVPTDAEVHFVPAISGG